MLQFFDASRSSGWQRFSIDRSLRLRIRASVNGRDVSAVLDSGAGRTLVDSAFATTLGLRTRAGFTIGGVTGSVESTLTDDAVISIGALTISGLNAAIVDMRAAAGAGDPIPLLLGREVFENC